MRIFDRKSLAVLAAVLLASAGVEPATAKSEFATPTQAYRLGIKAAAEGNYDIALTALFFAAENGVLGAELKLAEMYQSGEGVPQSDAKAFRYYGQIADQFAEVRRRHPITPVVSKAFIALADYYRSGVAELNLEPDPQRALGLYRHAASFFGDPRAQFKLAKMYLAGEGIPVNARIAVNWLANASKKQHAPSQALLGNLLWRGAPGVRRRPLKGLALMDLARTNAKGSADAVWIEELFEAATAEAPPDQREQAVNMTLRWRAEGSGQAAISEAKTDGEPAGETDNTAAKGVAPVETNKASVVEGAP